MKRRGMANSLSATGAYTIQKTATIQANPDKFLRREQAVGAKDVLRQLLK